MKKTITSVTAAILVVLTMSSGTMDDNGRAGVAGSPTEKTCNQAGCHNSYTVNTGGGSVKITCPTLTNWSYVPNQTYAISVTVSKTGVKLFGLGFEAITSAGANAGTLSAGTGTVLKSATVSGNTRTSVTHAMNGGTGTTDSHTFTFNWKAPATDIGKITFYCTGNAANGANGALLDYIYTTSQEVTSPSTVEIEEQAAFTNQISIFPNPASDHIQIANTNATERMAVKILDLKGSVISQKQNFTSSDQIELNELNSGSYLLHIEASGKVAIKKFIKQ